MPVVISGSDMVTALGDAEDTLAGLYGGRSAVAPLAVGDPAKLGVGYGYPIGDGPDATLRASRWLVGCVQRAVAAARLDPAARVVALVGTGLRELRSIERWHGDGDPLRRRDTHFASAVRSVLPAATEVHTLSNACAASGYALALGADLLELGEADAVVVAGTDSMTESMLTMIGRVGEGPVTEVRPFEVERGGVLLGEGAAALVLQRAGETAGPALGRLLAVAMTCDAHHETAPLAARIADTVREAHRRAGIGPSDVDLVIAHGTATALNDPTEAAVLTEVFGADGPLVTGLKGSLGHTSGGAALMGVLVALEALRTGLVPATVGLVTPIEEAAALRLVTGAPARAPLAVAQVDAFGFGGVNAVALVAA